MPTGNEFKKARPGDALNIPAATFNTFIDAANALIEKSIVACVEKVYDEGDFAGLGIGT